MCVDPPTRTALADGAGPPPRAQDEKEFGGVREVWRHEAASRVEDKFLRVSDHVQAMIRSKAGPGTAAVLTVAFASWEIKRCHLVPGGAPPRIRSVCTYRCCRAVETLDHHRAACAGGCSVACEYASESVAASNCREAGVRVHSNAQTGARFCFIPQTVFGWKWWVAGCHMHGGVRPALHATMVRTAL